MSNPFGDDDPKELMVGKIALGVCVGVLAANAITWIAAELRIRWEVEEAASSLRDQSSRAQKQLEESRRASENAAARAANERTRAEAEQARSLDEQQRAEAERLRNRLEETERRESAWRRFYRPSPGCAEATASIECANEHIRAKREFEFRYANGQL